MLSVMKDIHTVTPVNVVMQRRQHTLGRSVGNRGTYLVIPDDNIHPNPALIPCNEGRYIVIKVSPK